MALGGERERVVDEVIDPTEMRSSFGYKRGAKGFIFEVSLPSTHGMPGSGELCGQSRGAFIEVGDTNGTAFTQQFVNDAATDAVYATSYESDFAGEAIEVFKCGGNGSGHGMKSEGERNYSAMPATARIGEPSRPFKLRGKPMKVKVSGSCSRWVRPSTITSSTPGAKRMR